MTLFTILFSLVRMAPAQDAYWYKCFKGTIDKYPFTLHLHKLDHTYSGYYYYNNMQQPLSLLGDDTSSSGQIRLLSYSPRFEAENELFTLTLQGDSLQGKWERDPSASGRGLQVKAARDQSAGLRFDLVYTSGSEKLRPKMKESPVASYEAATVWPKGSSAAITALKKIIATELGAKNNPADIGPYLLAEKKSFLSEYLKDNKAVPDSELVNFSSGYSQDVTTRLLIVYHSPTILTLADFNYGYTGGAHGNYNTTYISINPATGKQYTLVQVLSPAGKKQLNALLAKYFRKDRKLSANTPLTEGGLFDDKLEANNNFFLTGTGIGFSYAPYEIGPFAMGEIIIFIPYSEFGKNLNPSFRK
ncbi:MAG TPA: DUF3298 domain-containing protein [Chitinophagaceae bacterium]|nr:DUF3298 domain-containing protein [Chitinophagaceae bacterium]